MENLKSTVKNELVTIPKTENQKGIENHKKAANHFNAAAKSHLDAAEHHENGDHEKAAQSTIVAHGHVTLANKAQKKDVKQHAKRVN